MGLNQDLVKRTWPIAMFARSLFGMESNTEDSRRRLSVLLLAPLWHIENIRTPHPRDRLQKGSSEMQQRLLESMVAESFDFSMAYLRISAFECSTCLGQSSRTAI